MLSSASIEPEDDCPKDCPHYGNCDYEHECPDLTDLANDRIDAAYDRGRDW